MMIKDLARYIKAKFINPAGGRPTNQEWTLRRLVSMSEDTLTMLQALGKRLDCTPMQAAAILVEETVKELVAIRKFDKWLEGNFNLTDKELRGK